MAGGNLSPRQKMIGMMYLVLTALLALNISKEIVLAFIAINNGIEETVDNFNSKNAFTYGQFAKQETQDPVKVKPFNDKAKLVKKHSDDLVKEIEQLKQLLIGTADQLPKEMQDTITLKYTEKGDENNIPAEIMVGSSADGSVGKARELKNKILDYKQKVLAIVAQVDKEYAKKIDIGLDVSDPPIDEDGVKYTWEMHNFGHYPLAPVVTLLSKLQSDVRNAEADIINWLFTKISAADYKFDALVARVIPKSSYVFVGQDYEADVFVAAFSTTQDPEVLAGNVDTAKKVIIGTPEKVEVVGGMGKYKKKASAEGVQKWGGIINVKSPDGKVEPYFFKAEYIVAKPNAVISPEKMNVLYIGLDNPVSISVGGGIADEKIDASITEGSLTRVPNNKGHYIAKVSKKGETTIRVSAEVDGKRGQSMGEMKFRVKEVPPPVPMIAKKKGGVISKALLAAQAGVSAELENFDFEGVRYVVTAFELTIAGKGRDVVNIPAKGNMFTPDMITMFGKLRLDDRVYFENIKAVGPGGNTRDIGSVAFKIQ